MIYDNIDFHNVEDLKQVNMLPGLRLVRFPKKVQEAIIGSGHQHGVYRSMRPDGCELRFVSPSERIDIDLMAVGEDSIASVFYGSRFHKNVVLPAGKIITITLKVPEQYKISDLKKLECRRNEKTTFADNVWRIQVGLQGFVHYLGLNSYAAEICPPKADEVPARKWLAYGSSITCGMCATSYANSYVNKTAVHLGLDSFNKAMSGSCFIENAVADYYSCFEADLCTLELGINMCGIFEPAEFKARVEYLLKKISENKSFKKIAILDIFPHRGEFTLDTETTEYKNTPVFRAIVKEAAEYWCKKDSRFIYIESKSILPGTEHLCTDILHPSDEGHSVIARKLAEILA